MYDYGKKNSKEKINSLLNWGHQLLVMRYIVQHGYIITFGACYVEAVQFKLDPYFLVFRWFLLDLDLSSVQ